MYDQGIWVVWVVVVVVAFGCGSVVSISTRELYQEIEVKGEEDRAY